MWGFDWAVRILYDVSILDGEKNNDGIVFCSTQLVDLYRGVLGV